MNTAGVIAVAAGALLVGLGSGLVLRSPHEAWTKIRGAVTSRGIVVLLLGAAIVGGLVLLSRTEAGSPQLWGQLISAVVLAVVTMALFSTGELVYTPKREFITGTGEDAKTYTVGSILTETEFSNLGSNQQHVTQQRGLYFRGLYTGTDGRWSTSKVQVLLWTYAVVYALIAIFVALELDRGLQLDQGEGKGTRFGDLEFDDQYLLLLGGYFAAALLAKGITTSRVENGNQIKPATEEAHGPVEGAKDLVSNDAGQGDIGDTQFFLFNVVALGVFFVSFVPHLEQAMPDLPWFLVGLTGVSALAYVGKKSVEGGSPTIAAVVPSKGRPRDKLRIEGSYLAGSLTSPPSITIDGVAVVEPTVLSAAGPYGEQSVVQATVPDDVTGGKDKTVSVTPRGAKAVTAQIEIVQTDIIKVDPEPVPWRGGVPVTISGKDFGSDPGTDKRAVKLANVDLAVTDWRDDAIVAKLPDALPEAPAEAVQLVVARDGMDVATRSTKAGVTPMAITAVDPVTLIGDVAVAITGTGFGPPPGGNVTLNNVRLAVPAWSDTQIVAVLGDEFPPVKPPPPTYSLKIARPGYGDTAKPVPVTLPAVTVTDVHPPELPAVEGTTLTVVGTNFGHQGPVALKLGEMSIQVVEGGRSDTLLQATLGPVPPNLAAKVEARSQLLELVVSRERWAPGSKEVTLTKAAASR